MRLGVSQINRYVYWNMLKGLGISLSLVVTIMSLVAFVELSRSVGSRIPIGFFNLAFLTFLQLPSLIEQTLPIIFLSGSLWTLFHLNRTHELIILKASGFSIWNLLTPFLILALFAGILAATVYSPVSAKMKTSFETLKNEWIYEKRNMPFLTSGIWMREGDHSGQTVIHGEAADLEQIQLKKVTLYQYEYNYRNTLTFARRIDAELASLKPGFWQLENVKESRSGYSTNTYAHMSLPTRIDLDAVYESASYFSKTPSFWELPKTIQKTAEAGFSTRKLSLRWYSLLAQPFILASMVLIAALVSLQHTRSGGTLRFIAIGGSTGFLLYFINGLFYALGEAGSLPILLAIWTAPSFAICSSLSLLSFIEDG